METALQTESISQYNSATIHRGKPEENTPENKAAGSVQKDVPNIANRSLLIVDEDWW